MAANVARAAAAAHQTEAGGLLVAHWAGSPALAHLTAALPGWMLAAGLAWNPTGCQHNKVGRVEMRSSLEVRASDFQCNSPGLDPSIRRHSGI
jgi:hypothetical protein